VQRLRRRSCHSSAKVGYTPLIEWEEWRQLAPRLRGTQDETGRGQTPDYSELGQHGSNKKVGRCWLRKLRKREMDSMAKKTTDAERIERCRGMGAGWPVSRTGATPQIRPAMVKPQEGLLRPADRPGWLIMSSWIRDMLRTKKRCSPTMICSTAASGWLEPQIADAHDLVFNDRGNPNSPVEPKRIP